MPICSYCGKEKKLDKLTQEHVVPKAIGGNLLPKNPFLLNNVCKRCNNIAGTYIDGPFIKSWFTQNNRTEICYRYTDISKNPILPLRYMGICEDLNYEGKICELWLGPTGDTIYHFHLPYPDELDISPMIGIPTYARKNKIDHGFAFLFVRSNNPIWHPTIFYSFNNQFKNSIVYLGNGPTPKGGRFSDVPTELEGIHKKLLSMRGKMHSANFSIGMDYGDRFLAKLGLGIGCILLNDSFAISKSANLLRKFMWTKNSKERENIPIHGSNFTNMRDERLKNILTISNGHLIALTVFSNCLYMFTSFYGNQNAGILISSEPEHWEGKIQREGIVYVIAPGLQKCVGPKDLVTFIVHKVESDYLDNELSELEGEMNKVITLPPYDI